MAERIIVRTGEALVAGGPPGTAAEPEIVIGARDGPVGTAMATLLGVQVKGHTRVFAFLNTDVQVRPACRPGAHAEARRRAPAHPVNRSNRKIARSLGRPRCLAASINASMMAGPATAGVSRRHGGRSIRATGFALRGPALDEPSAETRQGREPPTCATPWPRCEGNGSDSSLRSLAVRERADQHPGRDRLCPARAGGGDPRASQGDRRCVRGRSRRHPGAHARPRSPGPRVCTGCTPC
jgi:formaldehyde-activating enzyme (Fae)